jgi:hypothetical protein
MLTVDLLAKSILDNINAITIQVPANRTNDDGSVDITTQSSTIGQTATPAAAQLNSDMANAIAKAIIDNLKYLEIVNGQFSLVGGTMSNTLTGATVTGGPATLIGGTIASETGTVSIPQGAIQ